MEVDEQKYYIVLIYVSQPAEWLGGFWEVLFKPTHECQCITEPSAHNCSFTLQLVDSGTLEKGIFKYKS